VARSHLDHPKKWFDLPYLRLTGQEAVKRAERIDSLESLNLIEGAVWCDDKPDTLIERSGCMQRVTHLQLGRLLEQPQTKRHVFRLERMEPAQLADVPATSNRLDVIARTARTDVDVLLDQLHACIAEQNAVSGQSHHFPAHIPIRVFGASCIQKDAGVV
jgi:hypothetical protein